MSSAPAKRFWQGLADKVRRGDPIPFPVGLLLQIATPAVRFGMWRRLRKPAQRVAAHVVSFGNLTAGGTGKTPAVIERAREEVAKGKRVGILTRGYGSPASKGILVSNGLSGPEAYPRLGDEAALILSKVPEAIVFKSPDRVAAARRATQEHGCEVLLLDDGFQYTMLERDENILLIDAANPFGNGALLPRGILREPIGAMTRATAVWLTRCDQAHELGALMDTVARLCGDTPIRKTVHAPTGLRALHDGRALPLEHLRGQDVTAACAIGNPEAFVRTLRDLGAGSVRMLSYPDHRVIPRGEVPAAGVVVVTEKDAVRFTDPPPNVLALCVELADFEDPVSRS